MAISRRSLPRAAAVISIVVLALASAGCSANLDRGKVLFSTDKPTSDDGCTPANLVTSVSNTTSVYPTYVYKSRPGDETLSLEVTRDGAVYIPSSDLPAGDSKGLDCFADTSDLSKLDNWGAGTYHISLTSGGTVWAEGDLTVTGPAGSTGSSGSPAAGASGSPAAGASGSPAAGESASPAPSAS
jgi:hypothetical protein